LIREDGAAPALIDGHARANRQKPSGIAAKEMIVRVHLVPALGTKPLDTMTNQDVQQLKHRLLKKAPKTVNNILTVLNMMLKKAVEWDVIERMPSRGASTGDSGVCRPCRSDDDATAHAPNARSDR